MSNGPFRFVHAADLHLEQPLSGVTEVPEHLRELFLEAPYWAAQRVFEAVLAEEASFLILAGDVLDPLKTGPRGPLFLAAQFERLAEHGINVYWAGGRIDTVEAWPSAVRLPDNVHVFPSGRPGEYTFSRDQAPLVRLVGTGRVKGQKIRARDFDGGSDPGRLSVAIIHGQADPDSLKARSVDYWALGGSHVRSTLFNAPHTAHDPGSPQARHPDDTGAHGCTLVEVDAQRRLRTTLVPCDAVRWQSERVVVDESTHRADLEKRLHDRVQTLKESLPGTELLIRWQIVGTGPLVSQLRHGAISGEILSVLRTEYGAASPLAWSVSLAVEPCEILPPSWYEQETIRGDYLREIRTLQRDPETPVDLQAYLPAEGLAGSLAAEATLAGDERQRVLREAAVLGVDLLSGEESLS